MKRLFVISGCSGGGKSTLIEHLSGMGYACVLEPGRRIIAEETATGGSALPWVDLQAFAERAVAMAKSDIAEAASNPASLVFFDRSLIDAATALEHATGMNWPDAWKGQSSYARTVFMAPPWREIFTTDPGRRHGFAEAVAEYDRLILTYQSLNFGIERLPLLTLEDRAEWLLERIGLPA